MRELKDAIALEGMHGTHSHDPGSKEFYDYHINEIKEQNEKQG
jgi:hypothetical protein